MKLIQWSWFVFYLVFLSACTTQTPSSQLARKDSVRICAGDNCAIQDTNTTSFRTAATDSSITQRLKALVELGEANPRAAYDLSLRFMRGDGVERDSYQALEWMRKAGNQGLAQAQLALGNLYLMGLEEMGSDPAEAESWLQQAAAQGIKEAQPLIKQAQTAKKDIQNQYQASEIARKSWNSWYPSAPYYWTWQDSQWRHP